MRKTAVASFAIVLMLLVSCASTQKAAQDQEDSYAHGRESAAIALLGADMAEAIGRDEIPRERLLGLLPESYSFYAGYSPSYSDLESAYIKGVGKIVQETLAVFRPAVKAAAEGLSVEPKTYIKGDTTLSLAIEDQISSMVAKTVADEVKLHSSDLEQLYALSGRTFGEIARAYGNLSDVGLDFTLPMPEAISEDDLVAFIVSEFHYELTWFEKLLKNTPASAGTLYTVFWED